ncbi:hypothetical protein KBD45_05205 [Candidatus Dojkabacteria bacterium]|nr:hypothetical protein [Candidatus Dojkabacteria bacterium]
MKYIFLFFVLNLICFGALAVLSDRLPIFTPQQLEFLQGNYGIDNNEAFATFFDEMKSQGLILEMVNKQNAEIVGGVAFLNLLTLLTTIHLLIDKLFFKTISEAPSTGNAIRRSLLLSLIVGTFIILKLYNLLEWYLVLFVAVLFIFVEFVLYKVKLSKKIITENDEIQGTTNQE